MLHIISFWLFSNINKFHQTFVEKQFPTENNIIFAALQKHLKKNQNRLSNILTRFLTHFQPMFHFYNPWKHQKTSDFLIFSGGIEVEHCWKWVNNIVLTIGLLHASNSKRSANMFFDTLQMSDQLKGTLMQVWKSCITFVSV